jgi:hypothetical protein
MSNGRIAEEVYKQWRQSLYRTNSLSKQTPKDNTIEEWWKEKKIQESS